MAKIASHIRFLADEDGAVLLDVERNRIITLNPTGGFICTRLEQGRSVEMIVQELAQVTDTAPDVVEKDLCAFLGQLTENRLLDT
jgi:hypothetical protein